MVRNSEEERGNPKGGGNGKGRTGKSPSGNELLENARYFTGWDQTKFVRQVFVTTGKDSSLPTFSHCQACLEAAKTANGKVPLACRKAILATTLSGLPKRAVLDPDFQRKIQIHVVQGIPRHKVDVSHVEFVREPLEVTWINPRKELSCAEICSLLKSYYPQLHKLIIGEPPKSAHSNVGSLPTYEDDHYSYIGQNGWGDRC